MRGVRRHASLKRTDAARKRPFSLHRYCPEKGAGLSVVSRAPLIAQIEFDAAMDSRRRALRASNQALFACVPAALDLLALMLTVAAVQTVGAAIVPDT